VPNDNIFWQAQEQLADHITTSLDAYRDMRDHLSEALFHAIYGSPLLQAIVGLKASDDNLRRKPGEGASHKAFIARRLHELRTGIGEGGPREAAIRALLYVRLPEGVFDERGFHLFQRMRDEAGSDMTLAAFKTLVREQFLMLLVDERRAVEAIPLMLRRDRQLAARMAGNLRRVIEAVGLRSEAGRMRLAEVEKLFEVPQGEASKAAKREKDHLPRLRHVRAHPARSAKH